MPTPTQLLTRRRFLRTSALGAALSATVPRFVERTFAALHEAAASGSGQIATGKDHPILVVLQLAGGNDGLNTLVPFADDAYYRARPTLAVPRTQVLALDDHLGLHPGLAALRSLYDDGGVAFVQGVGYPNPNRSHFRSTEIWQTASDAKQTLSRGWLGRYFDNCCAGEDAACGISLGAQLPQAFNADKPAGVAVGGADPGAFPRMPGPAAERAFAEANGFGEGDAAGGSIGSLAGTPHTALSPLAYLQRTALDAEVSARRIGDVLRHTVAETSYPKTRLGQALSTVGRLIAGGMPTRVYYLSHGGFDTHQDQGRSHGRLLTELGDAVGAFARDLRSKALSDQVTLLTFSEFGRRVAENGSKGTDHGTAAPMLVVGGQVRGGLYGTAPSLQNLDAGDLVHTVDFRSVYATVLGEVLRTPPEKVLGRAFPRLPFVRGM